jgi:exonuclease 3'-5' domain-containing protein 1
VHSNLSICLTLTPPNLHKPTTSQIFSNLPKMTSLELITTRELGKLELSEPGAQNTYISARTVMVDTSASLEFLADTLTTLEKSSGSIYIDLEGVKLSRFGSISIIQILVPSCEQVFIVDIHTLGMTAFDTPGCEGKSLKDALESASIKKYLFDVRNDSDALYALFGVRLANAVDIQLLELASREGSKHAVCGLAKCIEQERALPSLALSQWQSTKKEVVKMFDPKLGGSYEVFNVRPLPQVLIEYCVGDVEFLPLLSTIYQSRLDRPWREKVRVETEKRLEESRSPSYQPHGRQKSLGPKRWRFPPEEGKKSTATVTAPASKKGQKLFAPIAVTVPEKGNTATATGLAPAARGKGKATTTVAASAPKKEEESTAKPVASASKKGKKSAVTVAAPVPKNGKNLSARAAVSTPKEEEKSTPIVSSSAPNGGEQLNATVPSPAPMEKEKSTPAAAALAPKKGKKPAAAKAGPAPNKEEKPTTNVATSAPKKWKKPIATVGGTAFKNQEKPSAAAGSPTSKKREKPSAAPTPNKGGKSTATGSAPASGKGKQPIATVSAPTPKKDDMSKAMVLASAISSVPVPHASQKVLTQPK